MSIPTKTRIQSATEWGCSLAVAGGPGAMLIGSVTRAVAGIESGSDRLHRTATKLENALR